MALHRFTFRAMAAQHEILVDALDAGQAASAAQAAIADVARIEAKYSRYRDDSLTTAINRAAGSPERVAIDAETAALLRYAAQCHAQSGGAFDITSGVLRRAWDFRRVPPVLPGEGAVDALRALVGWDEVEWDDHAIRLPRTGMEIDFGGIGKEYAADRAATILQSHGVAHALVNLGGDVRTVGAQRNGTPWRVGIVHPRNPAGVIGSVELAGAAVATSGDYERFIEVDGRRYCHLLDARTGWPVDHWQSASVVAPVCTLAGTLATLAMLREDGDVFLRAQGFRFLLVDKKGRPVTA